MDVILLGVGKLDEGIGDDVKKSVLEFIAM